MTKLFDITGKAISGEWGSDDENNTGIPVIRTTNFTNEGNIDYSNVVTRSIKKKNIVNKFLKQGDIIIEKSGGSDDQPVGRVVYFNGQNNKYLFNNFTGLLRIKDTAKWNPRYVFWVLYASYKQGKTKLYQNRTTGLHNLRTDAYVKDLDIKFLPLEEQKHISEVLDKIRFQIELKEREISKLDTLIKARFVEMFGDPVLNSKNYPENTLANYINFMTSGSRGWSKYLTPKGQGWFLTIKNVKNSHISISNIQSVNPPNSKEAQRTKVREGDLLISITADLGRTGVVNSEIASHGTYINQHLTCVRLNTKLINPIYASYFLESMAGKRQFNSKNKNGVKAGLNFEAIKSLKLIIPPIKIQNEFVSFVQQVDKSKVVNNLIMKYIINIGFIYSFFR